MNILYINHYAGSPRHGMEFRPYYLAREWVRAGHAVRILAGSFSHVRASQPEADGQPLHSRTTETIDGIDYVWYPTPAYGGNGLGRVKNIWAFLRQVWADAGRISAEFRPDVVIASSTYPMDIWVARRIARKSRAKLVFEVHDLWPLSPVEIGGMSPSHPFIRLCQAAENAAYRDADLVVSMLPTVAEHARGKGLDLARLAIVPNGISLDDWQQDEHGVLREDIRSALDEARAAGARVVGYAGSHGAPNSLDTLLDAAALLRDENIRFILIGDGHERKRLVQRVRDEALANVAMLPPVPKAQVRAFLEGVHMAYLGAPHHPIYRFGVSPNKMIDYMMSGVPILYAIESGNDPVGEADCGVTVPPDDPAALAAAVRALSSIDDQDRQRMSENARRYAHVWHTYDALARRFLDAVRTTSIKS